jgi:hypothetical protein
MRPAPRRSRLALETVTEGVQAVLTFEDCLGLCELSEVEIRAVAEHEHLPQMVALELGDYLMHGRDGELLVSHMFIEDIRAAERRGDLLHAATLKRALRHFIEQHGTGRCPGQAPTR